jgi:hypothetical protein
MLSCNLALLTSALVLLLAKWALTMEHERDSWSDDERALYENIASTVEGAEGGLASKTLERFANMVGGGDEWVWRGQSLNSWLF